MTNFPRFSINTILICVALIAALVAFLSTQLTWIAERKRAIAWMQESDRYWSALGAGLAPDLDDCAPLSLRIFGVRGIRSVTVVVYSEKTTLARTEQLKELFPEAEIDVFQLGESSDASIAPPWNRQ